MSLRSLVFRRIGRSRSHRNQRRQQRIQANLSFALIRTRHSWKLPTHAYEAQSTDVPTSVQDNSFFTSVSSNGTQAGSAIIWAVGRPTSTTTPNVTLYAFNAAAQSGTFQLLYSAVAGTWPNVKANANIMPVVANGRVYVASYQALTIFGLLGQLAPVKQAAPLTMTANPMITERAGPQLFGTITSLSGNRIAVRLRDGASVSVDLTDAFRRYEFVVPFVGENVEVHGASAPDGSFMARSMWRTKEPATWGPDRLK